MANVSSSDMQLRPLPALLTVLLYLALVAESRSIFEEYPIENDIYATDDHDNVEKVRYDRSILFNMYGQEKRPIRSGDFHFGYDSPDGPEKWGDKFPDCRGRSQSPIDLIPDSCHTLHDTALQWKGYDKMPNKMKITNNGHTVVLQGEWDKECNVPCVRKRNYQQEFVFEQLHFHWGVNDSVGSEHTINGERFPLEMHVVHYRKDLGSMSKAAKTPGGLMVVGILFKVCDDQQTSAVGRLVQEFSKVNEAPKTSDTDPFPLNQLVLLFSKHYFAYNGSLTTPPCSESVNWVVNKRTAPITSKELTKFRHFTNHGNLVKNNYRPTQPLNGRVVQEIK